MLSSNCNTNIEKERDKWFTSSWQRQHQAAEKEEERRMQTYVGIRGKSHWFWPKLGTWDRVRLYRYKLLMKQIMYCWVITKLYPTTTKFYQKFKKWKMKKKQKPRWNRTQVTRSEDRSPNRYTSRDVYEINFLYLLQYLLKMSLQLPYSLRVILEMTVFEQEQWLLFEVVIFK